MSEQSPREAELMAEVTRLRVQVAELELELAAQKADQTSQAKVVQELRQSQVSLESIIDNSGANIYVKDPAGRYLLVNLRIQNLYHFSGSEAIGKTDYELFPDTPTTLQDEWRENDRRVLETRQPFAWEEVVVEGDEPHTYLSVKFPLINEVGEAYAVCGISTDITERKRLEAERDSLLVELAAAHNQTELERQRLYQTFEQAPALINVFRGPEHVFELANPPMRKVLGNRDLIGKPVREAQPELEGQGIYELLDKVYQTGEPFYGSEIAVKVDRDNTGLLEEGYFNFVYQPLYNTAGAIDGVLSFAYEVTDQVKARQSVEASEQHLEELNRQKDEFLSIAAHELRSPLTSIKGFAQLLERQLQKQLDGGLPQAEQTVLEKNIKSSEAILRQVERMGEQINRLLEFSRIENRQLKLEYTAHSDLAELIRQVVEQQAVTTDDITILAELPAEAVIVAYDEARIVEVLNNLISNAIKYSPRSTTVTVGLEGQNNEVVVWVRDEGYGIASDEQTHLFEKFYRARSEQAEKVPGLGLGLYISCEIIKQHSGRMWVESEVGRGSTFYFSLPLKPATTSTAKA